MINIVSNHLLSSIAIVLIQSLNSFEKLAEAHVSKLLVISFSVTPTNLLSYIGAKVNEKTSYANSDLD